MKGSLLSKLFHRTLSFQNPSRKYVVASELRFSIHDEFTRKAEEDVKSKEELRKVKNQQFFVLFKMKISFYRN